MGKIANRAQNVLDYHRGRDYMRRFFKGEVKPYMFHMSWTKNKENKRLYLEQVRMLYRTHMAEGRTLSDSLISAR